MAASPPIQQTLITAAPPAEVERYLSGLNVTGWVRTSAPSDSLIWSHRYMSTGVLVVGVILLLTTLIGGLVLLIRDTEKLVVTLAPLPGGGTKVVVSGAADTWISSGLFQMLNQLPPAQAPSSAPTVAPTIAPAGMADSPDSPDDGDYKICPDCAERVRAAAKICRFCKYDFESPPASGDGPGAR